MRYARLQPAFTLIEMLVVIAIIGVLVGISFPFLSAMQKDTNRATAINTIGVAATTAQAYATRPVVSALDAIRGNPTNDPVQYSGAAAIFTHDNQILIVENDLNAVDASITVTVDGVSVAAPLERIDNTLTVQESSDLLARHLNGFKRIVGLDAINLPTDAGVVGIMGPPPSAGDPPLLVYPEAPSDVTNTRRWFAVWFNNAGQLIVGDQPDQYVYYDHGQNRYDADTTDASNPDWLPTVTGVYLYSRSDREDAEATGDVDWSSRASVWNWLHTEKNGHLVVLLKQTGNSLRNARD